MPIPTAMATTATRTVPTTPCEAAHAATAPTMAVHHAKGNMI
ncbi:MAG TPA: hypothetical protein VGH76_24665 [Actinomycetospora sp.]|jgi:hypothetical protein